MEYEVTITDQRSHIQRSLMVETRRTDLLLTACQVCLIPWRVSLERHVDTLAKWPTWKKGFVVLRQLYLSNTQVNYSSSPQRNLTHYDEKNEWSIKWPWRNSEIRSPYSLQPYYKLQNFDVIRITWKCAKCFWYGLVALREPTKTSPFHFLKNLASNECLLWAKHHQLHLRNIGSFVTLFFLEKEQSFYLCQSQMFERWETR